MIKIQIKNRFTGSMKEFSTKRGTDEFRQIEAVYLAHKAYLQHLTNEQI